MNAFLHFITYIHIIFERGRRTLISNIAKMQNVLFAMFIFVNNKPQT